MPPGEPIILDETGAQIKSLIGPYNEGEPLVLICEAIGGKFVFQLKIISKYLILSGVGVV